MRNAMTTQREAAEDIFFGQSVIHWARWFVIAAGTVIVLLIADTPTELIVGITPIIGLIALNFYIHGRRLAEKPANAGVVVMSSLVDVVLITVAVAIGAGTQTRGLESQFYVAYVPVILAFAFVMPRRLTAMFTAAVVAAYGVVCVLPWTSVTSPLETAESLETLAMRVVVMIATGGIGSYFWRIQRSRRQGAQEPELA